MRVARRAVLEGLDPGGAHRRAERLGRPVVGRVPERLLVGGERRAVQTQPAHAPVARREAGVLGDEARRGGRCGHPVPEHEAVVGALGERGGQGAGAVEQARLVAGGEARAVSERRVAERGGEQVVEAPAARRQRRLAGLEERLEEHLPGQIVGQRAGRHLLLALHHPAQPPGQRHQVALAPAGRPDVAHGWPRSASRYSTTRTSPATVASCSAGTPPVWWLAVRIQWRMSSTRPPVRACSER